MNFVEMFTNGEGLPMPSLRATLEWMDLTSAMYWVVRNNRAWDNPYHNTQHCFEVAQTSILIFDELMKRGSTPRFQQDALVLAALFHDVNHSGGSEPDSVNVRRSVEALEEFSQEFQSHYFGRNKTEFDNLIGKASELILATEYPYTSPATNTASCILRDADRLSSLVDCDRLLTKFNVQTVAGLFVEIGDASNKTFTAKEIVDAQWKFFSEFQSFTTVGEDIARCVVERFVHEKLEADLTRIMEEEVF